jgi:polyhydroxyalkanoate synthesis regulator phasin
VEAGRDGGDRPAWGSLEQRLLAALGWAALTVEGVDGLADDLARRVGVDRGAMRSALRDTFRAWRHEGERFNARRENVVDGVVGRLGVAQRAEVDDLVLRVAQLEHRLKLFERE